MDTGKSVRIGQKIGEGGFSYVFEAFDSVKKNKKYALKRIHVGDDDTYQSTQREATVHRSLKHPNIMPLLGIFVSTEEKLCYMLFPYFPQSLRTRLNDCIFNTVATGGIPKQPFSEKQVLQLFYQLLSALSTMHLNGYAHCDVKLENILLQDHVTPILMDFGSVSTLTQSLTTRQHVMTVVERASQHTTLPYRPPELLEGTVRAGDAPLDMTAVDVWSLGCTFFATLYGASPFECDFTQQSIKIVVCSPLTILGKIPKPPLSSEMASWYSVELIQMIESMLQQDRRERPSVEDIMVDVSAMITAGGGKVPRISGVHDEDGGDLDALLSSSRFL